MMKMVLLMLVLGLSLIPTVFAQEITYKKIDGDNQTIIHVVTLKESTDNSHSNGEVMITSATLLGFIGLGSIFSSSLVPRNSINELRFFIVTFFLIGTLFLIQLQIIISSFDNSLTVGDYTFYMQTTMILVVLIMIFILIQVGSAIHYKHEVEHKERNVAGIMRKYYPTT